MSLPASVRRNDIRSWGRVDRKSQEYLSLQCRDQIPEIFEENDGIQYLMSGLRRSYGDSCLNREGVLVDTTRLDRFISFDPVAGIIHAEAGASLSQILDLIVPKGWFLPTTPGTRFVTLGGAIANDVHGKNHHHAGSFGCHVEEISLFRSDRGHQIISSHINENLFVATVGGLGLTGAISSAKIKLSKIPGAFLDVETICYGNLDEFFELSESSELTHEHTVSWIDCSAKANNFGRGVFSRANWCSDKDYTILTDQSWKVIPVDAPEFFLNGLSISAFNEIYYQLNKYKQKKNRQYYANFFYPLDTIGSWNKLYGKRGMYQYQCVAPRDISRDVIKDLLAEITRSGQGSFLAVLKTFGDIVSPGLLSFPRPGTTLALDFPNRGEETLKLMGRLDAIIVAAGGALYPAKDCRMTKEVFRKSFPKWQEFIRFVDPKISSDFWKRVAP